VIASEASSRTRSGPVASQASAEVAARAKIGTRGTGTKKDRRLVSRRGAPAKQLVRPLADREFSAAASIICGRRRHAVSEPCSSSRGENLGLSLNATPGRDSQTNT